MAEGSHPTADAAGIDAEEVGHLWDGVTVVDALDGQAAAVLQDIGGACWSHASKPCKLQAVRALLSSELIDAGFVPFSRKSGNSSISRRCGNSFPAVRISIPASYPPAVSLIVR